MIEWITGDGKTSPAPKTFTGYEMAFIATKVSVTEELMQINQLWLYIIARIKKFFFIFYTWFDTEAAEKKNIGSQTEAEAATTAKKVDWIAALPFLGLHIAALGVFFVTFSWFGVLICLLTFLLRMFAITAFYHRYFSHRTFKCNRFWQFIFAVMGASAVQRGPLWWAANHREHHRHPDTLADKHSPKCHGFWWSHCGWFLSKTNFMTNWVMVKDLVKFPELRFLNRFDLLVPILFACSLFFLGHWLGAAYPSLNTSGTQLLFFGFFLSTVFTYHATFSINSLSHVFGRRRYKTNDESRNNWLLAILTLGEGWHNNHHYFCGSARQGFYWWEIDCTYYALKFLSFFHIVHDLKKIPLAIREKQKKNLR